VCHKARSRLTYYLCRSIISLHQRVTYLAIYLFTAVVVVVVAAFVLLMEHGLEIS
jgi:uncharacterized membrane protein YidH (DUF202 family)